MAEREFITYDGVKFRKYKGKEIGNTGHYQIEVDKIEDVTISGTYLDNWENVKEFRKILIITGINRFAYGIGMMYINVYLLRYVKINSLYYSIYINNKNIHYIINFFS